MENRGGNQAERPQDPEDHDQVAFRARDLHHPAQDRAQREGGEAGIPGVKGQPAFRPSAPPHQTRDDAPRQGDRPRPRHPVGGHAVGKLVVDEMEDQDEEGNEEIAPDSLQDPPV